MNIPVRSGMPPPGPTRRRLLLGGMAASLLAAARISHAASLFPRVAAIDWASAETLLAAGIVPIGIADLRAFQSSYPQIPDLGGAVDLGSAWEPNLELLDRLKPDAIYLSSWSRLSIPLLESIAPVRLCRIHGDGGDPLERALRFAEELLADVPESPGRMRLVQLAQRVSVLSGQLRDARHPVLLLNLRGSDRLVNVYSTASLPGSVLRHLGLTNAWTGRTNGFGFSGVGIERLIDLPQASIVILDQGAQTRRSLKMLGTNAIWNAVEAVAEGRVHVSPPVSIFGGVVSAAGFAEWAVADLRGRA